MSINELSFIVIIKGERETMEKYLNYLKRNNYSKSTTDTYKSVLETYKEYWGDIRLIKRKLKSYELKPNTISTHYSILHAYMKFSNDKRIKLLEEFNLPYKPNVYRPVFAKDYLYNKTKDISVNKNAVIRFMFETGIRASELSTIMAITNEAIVVKGKGNKIREIFHQIETTAMITNWNISTKTLRLWVKEVLGDQYTPHSIRRSHATHLLLSGANPKMVMLQLGHSKIETTYKYLQNSKELNLTIYNKHF